MGIGMLLHRLAPPRPPKPAFTRTIKSTIASAPGSFDLHFYVPKEYDSQRRLGFRSKARRSETGFPVVVNFHGGGFTLGTAKDDARWCGTVVDECNAVVVSVDYRLAPECPFPTAVEDGADAVLWIAKHAEELGLDAERIALSGFSSGGNMAFTVPLRLYDHQTNFIRPGSRDSSVEDLLLPRGTIEVAASSSSSTLAPSPVSASTAASTRKPMPTMTVKAGPAVSIKAIVPFYPSTDYTQTREQRRATTVRKDQELPALFTNLFDESYLHPPDTIPLDSPYLSPGIVGSAHLKAALPDEIVMFTCEWDMLLKEGQDFHARLISDEIGKRVRYTMVEGVPHGWDKAPNPLKPTPGVKEYYLGACKELRRVFGTPANMTAGQSGRRVSVPVVR